MCHTNIKLEFTHHIYNYFLIEKECFVKQYDNKTSVLVCAPAHQLTVYATVKTNKYRQS
jgi:hypothetical protein